MPLFRRKGSRRADRQAGRYEVADIFWTMRNHVLEAERRPEDWASCAADGLWAALFEMGEDNGVATVVMISDGAVSLYTTAGGGFIGMGGHEGPRREAHEFLALATGFLGYAVPAQELPLPQPKHIRFHFVTVDGVLTAEAAQDELAAKDHPLFPLFFKAHRVITEMRLVDEAKRGAGAGT